MPPLKLAVQLSSLPLSFKKAIPRIAELGVSAVEIDARGELNPKQLSHTGIRQLRKFLDDHGLRVAAVEFRTRRGYNVADDLDRRIEATKEALNFARSLGSSIVVNHLGPVPSDEQSPAWKQMIEVLSDLGAYSQRAGATLAAETGTENGAELRRLIDALPPGSLGVTLDPGNLIVNGFAPLDAIDALGNNILHVHAHDGVRDPVLGRGMEAMLGRGSADFPAVLAALEERGYRGYLSIERRGAADPLSEIALAVQYLKNLS